MAWLGPIGLRMARAGAPSLPCSLTGRQIISYWPPVTGDRSSPSMIQIPAWGKILWILARRPYCAHRAVGQMTIHDNTAVDCR